MRCWQTNLGEIQSSFGRSVTVLEHRYKDVTLYSGLGGHMSRQVMNFIFVEKERARKTLCIEKKTCSCVQRTSYGLPCACFIAMKIRDNKPIRLDEIHPHWHKLYMGEEESNEDLFSVAEERRGIQERLERVPFQMKLEIKEGLRLLAFPETTMLSPPPRKVSTKGAKEKKSNLHQKRHVGSHLRGRLLILNIRKVNLHHQKNLHNVRLKVLALAFLRFRFLSLSEEIMFHQILCITCWCKP